jgi:hypothetical protein
MWYLIRVKSRHELETIHNGELYNWVEEMNKFFNGTVVARSCDNGFRLRNGNWHLQASDVDVILKDIDPNNYVDVLCSQAYSEPVTYPGKIQWVPATSAMLGRSQSPYVSSSPISKNKLLLCL